MCKPSCFTPLRSTDTYFFRNHTQILAESNLNRPTPRFRAICQLPFRPSALSTVVRCRVPTSEHEIPCHDRNACASACCLAHSFEINASYNMLQLRSCTFLCRREGRWRHESINFVIERGQHTLHSRRRGLAQVERLRNGYRWLSSALILCCDRNSCASASTLVRNKFLIQLTDATAHLFGEGMYVGGREATLLSSREVKTHPASQETGVIPGRAPAWWLSVLVSTVQCTHSFLWLKCLRFSQHTFKISAWYNLLLPVHNNLSMRVTWEEGSNTVVIERGQHTRHSRRRALAQSERPLDGYRCSYLLSNALIHCCYRDACTQSGELVVVVVELGDDGLMAQKCFDWGRPVKWQKSTRTAPKEVGVGSGRASAWGLSVVGAVGGATPRGIRSWNIGESRLGV